MAAHNKHQELELGTRATKLPVGIGDDGTILENSYTVLKAFELPAGLSGSAVAGFFVPLGAPRPSGKASTIVIHDFNQLRR